ncbi:GNAT family N-acetyltransferase [Streptomyces huiliensis]|uniref:GNAT family N-acetyltransferase n=1 Tax=Streptomyces huiliensis TaxID=2876027 RepID=UPI001CBC2138|nr:GNAT family N-acetyltransferase [Streptomyces huiliensis]MBZ4317981.1 GNAT family N-acetyltransferase [Streptomyces huiliensis]
MVPVHCEPVTADTYEAVMALDVLPGQRDYVAPNVRSLADAWACPAAEPLALREGAELVGFALLKPAADVPGTVSLCRYMIDHRFQGRRLGHAGLTAVLDRARAAGYTRVRLSVVPGNHVAFRLYRTAGFGETGELEDGEIVLARDLTPDDAAMS